ncbi:MAG: ROK family protein [Candidatus Helarchaeales archaeon]
MVEKVLGIDIGGTRIRVATVDNTGNILSITKKSSHPFERSLFECIDEQIKNLKEKEIRIGVGSAGPLNPKTGVLHSPENLDCGEYPLKQRLLERYGATRIEIRNDLDAIALGYYNFARKREQGLHEPALAVIAPGTGLGSSILLDGQCYFGGSLSGYLALELGKVPYIGSTIEEAKAGIGKTLEDFTAGKGVISIYYKLFGPSKNEIIRKIIDDAPITEKPWLIQNFASKQKDEKFLKLHPDLANSPVDQACLNTYKNVGKHLGHAIATFVTLLNPNLVILEGSIGINAASLMMDEILKNFKKSVWPKHQDIPIRVGELSDAGVRGAASLVL